MGLGGSEQIVPLKKRSMGVYLELFLVHRRNEDMRQGPLSIRLITLSNIKMEWHMPSVIICY